MRRSTTTALGFGLGAIVTVLTPTGCAGPAETAGSSTPTHRGGSSRSVSAPLSSAQLDERLLDESDLGEGYIRKSETSRRDDDVTVIGCPALQKLGSDAATGSGLDFAHKAKATFAYTGSSASLISEDLYSDSASKLSKGIVLVSPAIETCGMPSPETYPPGQVPV
ncbi:hypothetical protein [Streptomyces flavofungini]|uniref:hypothetical protein n=1 Tax=Streptomyces flavofungini TaxID=68200 RepID=UPI0025B17930|nr:hypothetical protein [Streptomyces flavofungini]WJV47142.1 hypothetical protein QUY26_17415 [Streptomyces flavofungini]